MTPTPHKSTFYQLPPRPDRHRRNGHDNKRRFLVLLAAILLQHGPLPHTQTTAVVEAYVTSGLPGRKHRAWLKKMTRDIVDCPYGQMTAEMAAAAPQLMAVWAENPYVGHHHHHHHNHHHNQPNVASGWAAAAAAAAMHDPLGSGLSAGSPVASEVHRDHGLECVMEAEKLLKRLVDEMAHHRGSDDDEDDHDDDSGSSFSFMRRRSNERVVRVTTEEYNAVLFGWANSGKGVMAAERAEQILVHMRRSYEAGDVDVRPDTQSYRAVLLAWTNAAKSSSSSSVDDNDASLAARRAERVLELMVNHYRADIDAGASVAADYSAAASVSRATGPDADFFDAVLRLWSMSGAPDAPLRAERLLALMDRLYLDGNDSCRPRASSFDEVVTAWCRRSSRAAAGGGGDDGLTETVALEAARRADALLDHMERLADCDVESEGGAVDFAGPNLATYTSVASAWGRAGGQYGAQMATKTLTRLERKYHSNTDDVDLRPDTAIYNICIDAWVKARTKDSYRQARSVLDRQLDAYQGGSKVRRCRPDVYSYTLVLHACAAFSGTFKEKRKAFDVAMSTYQEMLSSSEATMVSPNHVTYGILMKAVGRLLPKGSKDRERYAREIFAAACEDGCVGQMVTNRLKEAVLPDVYRELIKNGEGDKGATFVRTVDALPAEWTRNVPEAERRQRVKSTSE